MEINLEDIKAKVWILPNPTGHERAIATIKIGPISISGIRVLENDEAHKASAPLWVAPPSYRTKSGKFHSILWTEIELWQKIQEKVLEAYNKLLEEKPDLRINLGEIPVIEEMDKGAYNKHYQL